MLRIAGEKVCDAMMNNKLNDQVKILDDANGTNNALVWA
jgi:hypothetical protein